jgi:hypothetical protein
VPGADLSHSAGARQSRLICAARMTGIHRSVSFRIIVRMPAGVLPTGSACRVRMRSRTSGICRASAMACDVPRHPYCRHAESPHWAI